MLVRFTAAVVASSCVTAVVVILLITSLSRQAMHHYLDG